MTPIARYTVAYLITLAVFVLLVLLFGGPAKAATTTIITPDGQMVVCTSVGDMLICN